MTAYVKHPLIRGLAFVMAVLLAINTIPSGIMRARALDGGPGSEQEGQNPPPGPGEQEGPGIPDDPQPTDSSAPSFAWATQPQAGCFWSHDSFNQLWGSGTADKCYFIVREGAPQAEGEPVSGLAKLFVYQGATNDLANVSASDITAIDLEGQEQAVSFTVTPGASYSFAAEDKAGNRSPVTVVTFKADTTAPEVTTLALFSNEECTDNAGIQLRQNAYTSENVMYLKVLASDSGSASIARIYLQKKNATDADFVDYESKAAVGDCAVFAIPFGELTEIRVDAEDLAGNRSGFKTITEWNKGLERNAFIVANNGVTVTAAVTGTGYDTKTPSVKIYGTAPEYTITLTDAAGESITGVSIKLNGTALTADSEGKAISADAVYASGETFVLKNTDEAVLFDQGSNSITVTAVSTLGIRTSTTFTFFLDRKAPVITGITFAGTEGVTVCSDADGVYAGGPITVSVATTDDTDELMENGAKTIRLYNNGELLDSIETSAGTAVFTLPKNFTQGTDYTYNLTVQAFDKFGNASAVVTPNSAISNVSTGNVMISGNPPTVTVTAPEGGTAFDGKVWYTAAPKIAVEASSGIMAITEIVISVNGTEYRKITATAENPIANPYTGEVDLSTVAPAADGSYVITVEATDSIHIKTTREITVCVDDTAPEISLSEFVPGESVSMNGPVFGRYYTNGTFSVKVTATDAPQGAVGVTAVDRIVLLINDEIAATGILTDGSTYSFAIGADQLAEGQVLSFKAYAIDKMGQTGPTATLGDVSYDVTKPTASAEASSAGETHVTGEEGSQKTWYSDSVTWMVKAADQVVVTNPETGEQTTLSGSGIRNISVLLNGQQILNDADGAEIATGLATGLSPVITKEFRISSDQAVIAADCSVKLTVQVTDNAGNVSNVLEQTVYIDGKVPTVEEFTVVPTDSTKQIHAYSFGSFTNGTLSVTVKAQDESTDAAPGSGVNTIILYVNGEEFARGTAQNGAFTFTVPAAMAEAYAETLTFAAVAVDASGLAGTMTALAATNSNLADASIFVENILPTAELVLTEEGKTIDGDEDTVWVGTDTEFTLKVKDADAGLASLKLYINNTQITADNASLAIPDDFTGGTAAIKETDTFAFDTAAIQDADGVVEIRILATDLAGNELDWVKTIRVDNTKPVVEKFEMQTDDTADTLNYLKFGTFSNGKVDVVVYVSDGGNSSGLDYVALKIGTETTLTQPVENGKATFTIPEAQLSADYMESFRFSASVFDKFGNESTTVSLDATTLEGMLNDTVTIERGKPTVTVTATGENKAVRNGQTWYSSDVTWEIIAEDAGVGIANVSITLNGQDITADENGVNINEDFSAGEEAVKTLSFTVKSSKAAIANGSSYTLTIKVKDNAGNESDVFTQTVYRDTTAPSIVGFKFNSEGDITTYETGDFAYYCTKDVTATVIAKDTMPGSGLKSITYYLKDVTTGKTQEKTAYADEDGAITFTIKAPFKGTVYAKANDSVNNSCGYSSSKGLVVESAENHAADPHIVFVKAATDNRQPNSTTELYNGNVELTIKVSDQYSGIRSAEWSVIAPFDQGKNATGNVTVGNEGNLTGDNGWTKVSTDGNLVTEMSRTIHVTHDSNDIVVRVRMTDRAGNQSEKQIVFGIDKAAPTVTYSFDNNRADAENTNIYDDARTLTIVVTERNFSPADFGCVIKNQYGPIPAITQWTEEKDPLEPNKSTHTATVSFVYDGSYTVALTYADRAGNAVAIPAVPNFIIDRSKPLISVTYDNWKAVDKFYFNAPRTATITVTERNFDVSRVTFSGNASKTGTWVANGEVHTLTVPFTEDGEYLFGISVTDRAGNVAVPYGDDHFVVDTVAPTVELSNIDDANKDEVAPIITVTDANFDEKGVKVTLIKYDGTTETEVTKNNTITEILEETYSGQQIAFRSFDPWKEYDGIYTITISAVDKAGNASDIITKKFSVNRFGSVYEMQNVENRKGEYISQRSDITFSEVNVDKIDLDSVQVIILRNNESKTLVKGTDYTVEEVKDSEKNWNEYRYTIFGSTFTQDGEYSVHIVSSDRAGNTNENDDRETSGIMFCIDHVAPNIIPISPVEETSYAEPSMSAILKIRDNYSLGDVMIYLNDKPVGFTQNGDEYKFEIPQSDKKQNIRVTAVDAAGNVSVLEIKDVLISTNMFVRFINNTAAVVGTSLGLIIAIGLLLLFLLYRRRNKA